MSNQFLTDCFAELASNKEARRAFNLSTLCFEAMANNYDDELEFKCYLPDFLKNEAPKILMTSIIQTLLSKVKNPETGQLEAVIPFLETKILTLFEENNEGDISYYWSNNEDTQYGELGYRQALTPTTLRELLLNEFTNALWNKGKTLEEALEIINKIYLEKIK